MNSIIHTPTNNLAESMDFYRRLNFKVISDKKPTLVSDGQAVIEINPDRYARAGIKLIKESWSEEIADLKKITDVISYEEGHMLSDGSGSFIYLTENKPKIDFKTEDKCIGLTGNFSGLSLETTSMSKLSEIYIKTGFSVNSGSKEQGWLALSREGFVVSLMNTLSCPHLFFNPSLTYFNGKDNLSVIQNIRQAEIPITEEITHFNKEGIVDNIIIRDPGGLGFFIFND